MNDTGYVLDNAWKKARERLTLQERFADKATRRRIIALGPARGWHCLEAGAGAGSVARWLSARVGPNGRVLAADLDTRFMARLQKANLEVRRMDVVSEELPRAAFDFVHTRLLLIHLPAREAVMHKLVQSLKPGGWLLLEEREAAAVPIRMPALDKAWNAMEGGLRAGGVGTGWAHTMPALLQQEGLIDIGAEGEIPVFQGDSVTADFWRVTWEQMRERMIATGLVDNDGIDEAMRALRQPQEWFVAPAEFAAWGRRPA
ncbi:MAG: class I SAM-dependent methyltransferase [Betaproteobacteria bacterium]|nr:class I SAM-dependent methyltransferase [Betaproteobacteria bacterium]